MTTETLTYLLMGLYPAPILFAVGFGLVHLHVRALAAWGGEEYHPKSVQRVVVKYREEKTPDRGE